MNICHNSCNKLSGDFIIKPS